MSILQFVASLLAVFLNADSLPPVAAHVPAPAVEANIGGRRHLVHELHITNLRASPVQLDRIELIDGRGKPFAVFPKRELRAIVAGGSRRDALEIEARSRAVAYFWVPLAARAPDTIGHRLLIRAGRDTAVIEAARIALMRAPAPVLHAPLRGGPWVAVFDPHLERGHRRVLFEESGAARIPARFAIDWMKIDADGQLASGDPGNVANHYGYGADVLAVADALVVAVRDGVPERSRLVHVAHGPELASGNFITLEIGNGRYVTYEHLKPGSVLVETGQRVRRGETIARVGFSGDGSHPHLHMHVSDGATPSLGEGQPWLLAQYQFVGSFPDLASVFAGKPPTPAGAKPYRNNELPAPNVVVMFSE